MSASCRMPAPGHGHLGQAALDLARFPLGTDYVEGVVLECPDSDSVAGWLRAVLAGAVVIDLGGGEGKAATLELAIDDGRDPPAGYVVAPKLEEPAPIRPLPDGGRGEAAPGRQPALEIGPGRGGVGRGRQRAEQRGSYLVGEREREGRGRTTHRFGRGLGRQAQLPGDRGRLDSRHAAGIDQLEVRQAHGHVEGDAVVAHAVLDADPDGPDLADATPAAGEPIAAAGLDAGLGAGGDQACPPAPGPWAARAIRDRQA